MVVKRIFDQQVYSEETAVESFAESLNLSKALASPTQDVPGTMIAKGRSISHLRASINYALRRESALVLDKNIVSETPADVAKEFKLFQDFNQRCERNSFSFVISPTIEDGKTLSQEQLASINKSFLEEMKLQNQQYIAFVHENTEHKHIHLYVNRIDYRGHAYNDQFISNRSSHAAEGIAQEMGLQTAKEVEQLKRRERQVERPEIDRIKHLAHATLQQREVNAVEKFVSAFNESGAEEDLRAEAYNNKKGQFQGMRFYSGEEKFKASEIDRSLSKQQLEHTLEEKVGLEKKRSRGMGMGMRMTVCHEYKRGLYEAIE